MITEIGGQHGDGGTSAPGPSLNGSVAQVEWAERIRVRVTAEFDRVVAAFQGVATKQDPAAQASTQAIIAIVEEVRAEVMRNEEAGYFIHDWQDISDQVRRLIFSDPRYQAMKDAKGTRAPASHGSL